MSMTIKHTELISCSALKALICCVHSFYWLHHINICKAVSCKQGSFFKSLAHTANVLCSDSNLLKGSASGSNLNKTLMRDLNLSALTLITSCANVILFWFRYSSCHKYPTKSPFLILLGFVSTPRSHYAMSPNVTHYRDNQKTTEPNGTTLLTYILSLC